MERNHHQSYLIQFPQLNCIHVKDYPNSFFSVEYEMELSVIGH